LGSERSSNDEEDAVAQATQDPSRLQHVLDRVFRNPDSGRIAIVQMPNLPLVVFLLATGARLALDPHGAARTGLTVLAAVGIVWWSADEVLRGDSLFRRVLGGLVLIGLVVGRLVR
jgi:hypothetical protein